MDQRNAPEINAGSMADIAFLLLVFFLITTTIDSEFGMIRVLPKIEFGTPMHVLDRNVLNIYINSENVIMVQGRVRKITEIEHLVETFIQNKSNRKDMPAKVLTSVPYIGKTAISKQVISLQSDSETSYQTYIGVQNALARAYGKLRDELSQKVFKMDYRTLLKTGKTAQAKAVKTVYPSRVSEAEPPG